LERKKTPLRQLNADKTTIPREEVTDKPMGRTIEITEVEYHYPAAGKEKHGEGVFPSIPECRDAECMEPQQKPGVLQGAKDKLRHGVEKTKEAFTSDKSAADQSQPGYLEGAKDKLRHGVEMAKEAIKPSTTTTTTDSELTENKPGVFERVKGAFSSSKDAKDSDYTYTDQSKPGVFQGAKNMVWQGVEKAKGVFSSTKITDPTELHPGNGYEWKRVVGEQGQVCWVATNDWSSDSSNRGGIIAGAKGMVRSGMEKARGVFASNKDVKESEFTDQSLTDQSKPGVLEGAKQKVWQGVEKAKSVFSSQSSEQHPGRSYTWHKTTGSEGQTHWVARNDWSNDSANQQYNSGVMHGAKEKVMQGVEKAKGVFSSTKTTETTVDPQLKDQATYKERTGTFV